MHQEKMYAQDDFLTIINVKIDVLLNIFVVLRLFYKQKVQKNSIYCEIENLL